MKDTDVLGAVRESFADVHLSSPLETIVAAGRAQRRRTATVRVSIAMAAVAALGLGALSLSGLSTPAVHNGGSGPGVASQPNAKLAAYTFVRNGDGSVTFTANDMVDTIAATQALNDAGIAGRVVNLGGDPGCTTTSADINPADTYPDDTNTWAFRRGENSATFESSDYPVGGGLLLAVLRLQPRPGRPGPPPSMAVAVVAFDDAAKIPTCLSPDVDP